MKSWRGDAITAIRDRLKEVADETERQNKINELAPMFWNSVLSELNSFFDAANKNLNVKVFQSGTLEASNVVYSATYRIGSESRDAALSWNKTERQITLTAPGETQSFSLEIDKTGFITSSDKGLAHNPEQLAIRFVRSLTKLQFGTSELPSRPGRKFRTIATDDNV